VLVTALAGWPRLTGELQRVVRILGEEGPGIEVLPPDWELPDYHRAALARSQRVSIGAEDTKHPVGAAWCGAGRNGLRGGRRVAGTTGAPRVGRRADTHG